MQLESPARQKENFLVSKAKTDAYLKMISIAICEVNGNRGTLRKLIWDYLLREFRDSIEYRDFILSISELLKSGRLVNKAGYYFV
jgi:hypothetical protein